MTFKDKLKAGVIITDISLATISFGFAAFGKYGLTLLSWMIIGLTTVPFRE